jgi:hypothetical protein
MAEPGRLFILMKYANGGYDIANMLLQAYFQARVTDLVVHFCIDIGYSNIHSEDFECCNVVLVSRFHRSQAVPACESNLFFYVGSIFACQQNATFVLSCCIVTRVNTDYATTSILCSVVHKIISYSVIRFSSRTLLICWVCTSFDFLCSVVSTATLLACMSHFTTARQ